VGPTLLNYFVRLLKQPALTKIWIKNASGDSRLILYPTVEGSADNHTVGTQFELNWRYPAPMLICLFELFLNCQTALSETLSRF
jgi:hypothetical protein